MSKLIQLKLSEKKLIKYNKLVDMLGLSGTFGEYQRAIEFGIDLAISELKRMEKVLPSMDIDKLELLTATITKLRKERIKADQLKKIAQEP